GPGGVVLLLAVDRQAVRRGVSNLEQERARPTGGVVYSRRLRRVLLDTDELGHHPRDLGRRVELPLALAGLPGHVAPQGRVGVPQQVVTLGTWTWEVEILDDSDQVGQAVDELLAPAELVRVVEVGVVDDTLKVVGVGQLPDRLVNTLADVRLA